MSSICTKFATNEDIVSIYSFVKKYADTETENNYQEYYSKKFYEMFLNRNNRKIIMLSDNSGIIGCSCISILPGNIANIHVHCTNTNIVEYGLNNNFLSKIKDMTNAREVIIDTKVPSSRDIYTCQNLIIPVNIDKLIGIGFLPIDFINNNDFTIIGNNPLVKAEYSHCKVLRDKIYKSTSQDYLDYENIPFVSYSLINIKDNKILDHIQFAYSRMKYFGDTNSMSLFRLSRFYRSSMSFDQLITFGVNYMQKYSVDQIIIPKDMFPRDSMIAADETDSVYTFIFLN